MARFQGGSPYIYPLYGLGELPQVCLQMSFALRCQICSCYARIVVWRFETLGVSSRVTELHRYHHSYSAQKKSSLVWSPSLTGMRSIWEYWAFMVGYDSYSTYGVAIEWQMQALTRVLKMWFVGFRSSQCRIWRNLHACQAWVQGTEVSMVFLYSHWLCFTAVSADCEFCRPCNSHLH